jgi:hypothetical protein
VHFADETFAAHDVNKPRMSSIEVGIRVRTQLCIIDRICQKLQTKIQNIKAETPVYTPYSRPNKCWNDPSTIMQHRYFLIKVVPPPSSPPFCRQKEIVNVIGLMNTVVLSSAKEV